jgi:D-alanyl-D-alanine carboxypeptidase (penicillin-binding protein 5/6)
MNRILYRLALVVISCCFFIQSVNAETDFTIVTSRYKKIPGQQRSIKPVGISKQRSTNEDFLSVHGSIPALQISKSKSAFQGLLSSRSAVVMDSQSGDVLYAYNPDLPGQPASTIKILTGLIALDALKKTEEVPVSKIAADMPRSKADLQAGETYTAAELICAVLLASANDASVALAEKIAGNERIFAMFMNYKAKEMGATDTVCKTATGLTANGQQSTVRDLAVLFNKAMQHAQFAEIMSRSLVTTSSGTQFENHNKALQNVYGAAGGKTGFTRAAKQTYVGKFCRDDDELIVALMGSEKMWDDLHYLVTYGFSLKKKMDARLALLHLDIKNNHDTFAVITLNEKLTLRSGFYSDSGAL